MATPTVSLQYDLPDRAIAQRPAEPRDSGRLLDTRGMSDHTFRELPDLLAAGDLVVVNNSRVRAARLLGEKEGSGGRVELVLLSRRANNTWEALGRPARRLSPESRIAVGEFTIVIERNRGDGLVEVRLDPAGDMESVMASAGALPLPPYLKAELADPERYQTVFAKVPGSAAAPTAGLHFTAQLLDRLGEREIEVAEIELEVGIDTFRPVKAEMVEAHPIHTERFEVTPSVAAAVDRCRQRRGRLVAVGTTTLRTLETAARKDGRIEAMRGQTDLFITPGYRFSAVDLLITNFHLPATTLVALVASLLPEWRSVYDTALARGYRFGSFGDAMLALVPRAGGVD
ncbi:MAG TPA: tRNA preQ1(34) S-adenosylmethionine ribosyltransferase-isomerase QueA [Acidimicrobiia bacterium]